ncbi:MAG: hypothetical protein WD768_00010 [Phycisphaeraceae bacterium]
MTAYHHESWADEADAWLAARDMTPGELWQWTGYAGHPSLWYLLIMPLAKLGLPYGSIKVLNWVFAVLAVSIIAQRGPWPRWFRVLIIFSYVFLYQYAVIARCYALFCLLLFSAASLYGDRWRKPVLLGTVLLLLANVTAHAFFLCGIVLLVWGLEAWRCGRLRGRVGAGLGLAAAGLILSFLQLKPPPEKASLFPYANWHSLSHLSTNVLFPKLPWRPEMFRHWLYSNPIAADFVVGIMVTISLAALVMLAASLLRKPGVLVFFIAAMGSLVYIFFFRYYGGDHHAALVLALCLFTLWIARGNEEQRWLPPRLDRISERCSRPAEKAAMLLIATGLIASVWTAGYYSLRDIQEAYSGSEEVAQFLRERPAGIMIAADHAPAAESISAYLGEPIWQLRAAAYQTYLPWNLSDQTLQDRIELNDQELFDAVQKQLHAAKEVWLITNRPLSEPRDFQLLFRNERIPFSDADEQYFVYRWLRWR